jgi:carbon-monoxide dehydrogenase large subunit
LPAFEVHHLETPSPHLPGGFKGAGEAGTAGAPAAVLNAVNDALAPFGVAITEQPVTPERVLRALHGGSCCAARP